MAKELRHYRVLTEQLGKFTDESTSRNGIDPFGWYDR
jgi:hypothetical protein